MRLAIRLKASVLSVDEMLAKLCLAATDERGSLLTFVFHGLFNDSDEIESGLMDPQQGIKVDMLRRFVLHFREAAYRFVSPANILKGLNPGEKNLLITFDDGYFNNVRALPVLEEFCIPAVFFISSDHVKYGKAFWWDVAFREFGKHRRTEKQTRRAIAIYKCLKTAEVESDLRRQFGESALRPIGDLDRPFSVSELNDFARHPLVILGNHTKDHAILTNYAGAEIREQIQICQNDIRKMTGKTPEIIAYPNGNESPTVRAEAWGVGLRLGIGTWPGKNQLPLQIDTGGAMTMRRFTLLGDRGIDPQCRSSRAGLSLYRSFKHVRTKFDPRLFSALRST
jgi:peptidoglycan/xylan/chitin deacetylase (PgdA/CDA1 family)